jgi:4-amino-4-deoxy-L-arabinose transferase-like glycosyltransferase
LLFTGLGLAPFERAEIYFLDGARSLLERGDWLVPYYRGEPFFDKPALTYWLIAAAFQAWGCSPGAARVVPALATLLTLTTTLALGTRLLGARAALAGGLMLVTTLPFVGFGRVAMSDMLLALWTNLALLVALVAYRRPTAAWPVPLLGAVLGLGFLTKGPIALLLPGLGLLALAWQQRREGAPPPLRAGRLLLAALLFAICGLLWWGVVAARLGTWPLVYFFLRENLERFAGATYDSGREPWFYVLTYLVQGAPWGLFLPLAVARLWRGARATPAAGDAQARLLLVWLGLMLLPLSASRGKIDYYLLPLYPAAALVLGHFFTARVWTAWERAWARGVLLVSALALLALLRLPTALPAAWLPSATTTGAVVVGTAGLLLLLAYVAWRAQAQQVLAALAGTAFLAFLTLVAVFLPGFREAQPNQRLLADVQRERANTSGVGFAFCEDPVRVHRDVLFHARVVPTERCDLWAAVAAKQPFLLLLEEQQWSLGRAPGMRHVATYDYVPATVLNLRTLVRGVAPGRLALFANYPAADPLGIVKAKRERRRAIRAWEQADEAAQQAQPGDTAPSTTR